MQTKSKQNVQIKKTKVKQKRSQKPILSSKNFIYIDKMPHTRIPIMMLTINTTTYLN